MQSYVAFCKAIYPSEEIMAWLVLSSSRSTEGFTQLVSFSPPLTIAWRSSSIAVEYYIPQRVHACDPCECACCTMQFATLWTMVTMGTAPINVLHSFIQFIHSHVGRTVRTCLTKTSDGWRYWRDLTRLRRLWWLLVCQWKGGTFSFFFFSFLRVPRIFASDS